VLQALLLTLGCAAKQVEPVMVSSAGHPSYAIGYADRLGAETQQLVTDVQQAGEQSQALAARKDELKPGYNPELLLVVVRESDEAGRSEAFVRANAEARGLQEFWEEARGPVASRANGAVRKQLSEGNCGACAEADASGTISYALTAGIDKQLEKRLRGCNQAHETIERNKELLGTGNLATAQKLADDIALTSYRVNVALPTTRNRIDALLAERNDVDATLERALEWEQGQQSQKPPAAALKRSKEQVAVLEQSRAAIAPAVQAAEAARKDVDPKIEDLRKRYAASLETLQADLEAERMQVGR
jgi:hypothetical protein